MLKPLKRAKALEEVSRDHHHGLLLTWKIRKALKLGIEPERIKKYTDWVWENDIKIHFAFEEKHMFPILGNKHKLIVRALREHARLQMHFTSTTNIAQNLELIEAELVAHIRFEERFLFNVIQETASAAQLSLIEKGHSQAELVGWEDEFWKV